MASNWIKKTKELLKGPAPAPETPEGERLYAIGDIHGRADLLERLHGLILADAAQHPSTTSKTLIYLGDYVDRGEQTQDVINMLSAGPLPGFKAIHLKGNHEAMMLKFIEDATLGLTWRDAGGHATLQSYGAYEGILDHDPMAYDAAQKALIEKLPEAHLSFLKELQLNVQLGDYFFVHAGVRPGTALDTQKEKDMLWIRRQFLAHEKPFEKIIVHGHTPDKDVIFKENRIGIDTGAWMTNILSCLVLEGSEQRLLQTD